MTAYKQPLQRQCFENLYSTKLTSTNIWDFTWERSPMEHEFPSILHCVPQALVASPWGYRAWTQAGRSEKTWSWAPGFSGHGYNAILVVRARVSSSACLKMILTWCLPAFFSEKRCNKVLLSSTSQCNLIWEHSHCRCNLLRWGQHGGGWAPNPTQQGSF